MSSSLHNDDSLTREELAREVESLRTSRRRFEAMVEHANDAMYIIHPRRGFQYVNAAFEQLTGYTMEDVKADGFSFWDIIHPDDVDMIQRRSRARKENQEVPSRYEFRILTKGNGVRIVEVTTVDVGEADEVLVTGILRDITDRVEMEQALQESKEMFRELTESAASGVCIIQDDVIKYANPALERITGYSQDELVGMQFWKLIHPDDRKAVKERGRRRMNGERVETTRYETRIISSSGTVRWIDLAATTTTYENRPAGLGHAYDITDRKEVEASLKERIRETEKLLQHMDTAFVLFESVFDDDGVFVSYRFVYINEAYEEITGVKNEEVKGKTVHEVWPETEPEWIQRYGEVAVTGESQTFELHHEPTEKTYHCTVYRPYDTPDRFCVVFDDITDRIERERRVQRERQKFLQIFNTANDAIYLHRLTEEGMPGRFIEVNDTACEMLGYSREEFLDMSPRDIDAEGEATDVPEVMEELVEQGEAIFEMHHQTKDGSQVPVEIHSQLIELEGEQRVLSVARDITERKKAEETLQKSKEDIAELNETLRLLNKTLRHDILNNLQVARSALELYEEEGERKMRDKAMQRMSQAVELINRMRGLESLVASGKDLRPINLRDIADDVAADRRIDCRVEGSAVVMADEALHSVVQNLVHNAVVHGKADEVIISMDCTDDECELRVADDGVGIPDEVKDRVFKEGFSHGDVEGTGLGLYIVKKTVERYGGSVAVEDNEPHGAMFVVRLQRANDA